MKCQHGRTVKVEIETNSPSGYWDDGIRMFDKQGKYTPFSVWIDTQGDAEQYRKAHSYLRVSGCSRCKTIKMR